jgi:hypothetical protein
VLDVSGRFDEQRVYRGLVPKHFHPELSNPIQNSAIPAISIKGGEKMNEKQSGAYQTMVRTQ